MKLLPKAISPAFLLAIAFSLFAFHSGRAQSCQTTNIAAGKTAYASNAETYAPASNAVDGNITTVWTTGASGEQTLTVDLGQSFNLCLYKVKWDRYHEVSNFKIQGSNDTTQSWHDLFVSPATLYTSSDGTYTYDSVDLSGVTTAYRFVRIDMINFVSYNKIDEIEIYNKNSTTTPTTTLTNPTVDSSYIEGATVNLRASVSSSTTISKVEFFANGIKIGQSTTSPYQYSWTSVEHGDYKFTASATDVLGTVGSPSAMVDVEVLLPPAAWSLSGNAGNTSNNFIGTKDNQPVTFKTANTTRMTIRADGNIGIGANPQDSALLAVNGTIWARKLKVTQSTWADYVFDKGYHLRSLPEIERYTGKYHHLPEVPSKAEIANKGLNVGDNQALLLQKIEELTIYLIKEHNELRRQSIELKKEKLQIRKLRKQLEHKTK